MGAIPSRQSRLSQTASACDLRRTDGDGDLETALSPHMLASLLGCIASRHRAWAFASLWLLALTIVNVHTGGVYRSTVLFAIPVAVVSWSDWRLGFVFAAASVLCAKFGGAMPEPGSPSPLWLDGMLAFIKLSIDAAVANAWGRRYRRRALRGMESDDLQHRGGNSAVDD